MDIKVTFLGTGTSQGVPVIGCDCVVCRSLDFRDKRLRSSVHVQVGDLSLVIDTGPDFRQQMLRANIRRLDAVLFTHEHKDHTAGLDDVRPFNFKQQRDMPLYARQHVIEQLKREFAYAFAEHKYPGVPQLKVHVIDNQPFTIEGVEIIPIEVMHYKLPVLGYRIGDFAYITDANHIAPEEKEKLKGLDVLVLNALRRKEHISHFTLEQALAIIEELKPQRAYLIHISHQMGLHREVEAELPPNVRLAYDGLCLSIPCGESQYTHVQKGSH
jgi:phosphoribosyl 1,2-cyclic phosphate phosphodiesterase